MKVLSGEPTARLSERDMRAGLVTQTVRSTEETPERIIQPDSLLSLGEIPIQAVTAIPVAV